MTARDVAEQWETMVDVVVKDHLKFQKGIRCGMGVGFVPISDGPISDKAVDRPQELIDLQIQEFKDASRQLR